MTTPDHDLVELLKQRVRLALEAHQSTARQEAGDVRGDVVLVDDVSVALDRLLWALVDNDSSGDPAVQAVARALTGINEGVDLDAAARELWALLHNGRRPDGHWDGESERYYRRVAELFLAQPWQVVDTEGGESS